MGMLVYLDWDGHRIVGAHYEGLDMLSICALGPNQRVASFPVSTSPQAAYAMQNPKVAQLATLRWAEANGLGGEYRSVCEHDCSVAETRRVAHRDIDHKVEWIEIQVKITKAA